MNQKERKKNVLEAAVVTSRLVGINKMTRSNVALLAAVGDGTVSLYFNTMTQLRRAVARHAMKNMDATILSQLIADPTFKKKLSPEHKELALAYLAE